MKKTVLGYEMRAVGHNPEAARFAGMPVNRVLMKTALLSGGLAALAGFSEVSGLKGNLTLDLSPGYGYSGIVVAMLAMLNPLGVIASAIFVAGIFVGADAMSRVGRRAELHRRRHGRHLAADHGRGDPVVALSGAVEVVMEQAFDILFTASFWVAAIRIASPLIFATMGELICERAGVLNLGIEGIMTVGAFAGWFTVYAGGDLWTGVAGRGTCRRACSACCTPRSPCRSACRSMSSASASRCSPPASPTSPTGWRCRR